MQHTWYEYLTATPPSGRTNLPKMGPSPPVHPWGSGYSIHPELTRSGARYLMWAAAPYLIYFTVFPALVVLNYQVISEAPQEQQAGMWQSLSSAMTGTIGIGSAGSLLIE